MPSTVAACASVSPSDTFRFNAPPIVDATLAIYVILLFFTLVQFGFATIFPFRVRYGHRIPTLAIVTALAFLTISYATNIAYVVIGWTVDEDGFERGSGRTFVNSNIAATLFGSWVDTVVFVAVALVLRDRYLTCSPTSTPIAKSGTPFTIASCILAILVFIFSTVYAAIVASALIGDVSSLQGLLRSVHLAHIANGFFYTYIALYIIATIFLVIFAFAVKKVAKADKITSLTLTAIIPLLCLRALTRLIMTIVLNRLEEKLASFQDRIRLANVENAINLASALLYGVFYLAAAGILVFFLMRPGMWDPLVGHAVLQERGSDDAHKEPYHQGGVQSRTNGEHNRPDAKHSPGQQPQE